MEITGQSLNPKEQKLAWWQADGGLPRHGGLAIAVLQHWVHVVVLGLSCSSLSQMGAVLSSPAGMFDVVKHEELYLEKGWVSPREPQM